MTTLLGPTPHVGCGTPVTVIRRPVVILSHTSTCRCPRSEPGCTGSPSAELHEIVAVDADGTQHTCSTERRNAMSRGAQRPIPTRRYRYTGAVPGPGESTLPGHPLPLGTP